MIGAGIMGGVRAPDKPAPVALAETRAETRADDAGRVVFKLSAEVDAETLIDTYDERFAIVINDAGLGAEEARRIGLEAIRRAFRVFRVDGKE